MEKLRSSEMGQMDEDDLTIEQRFDLAAAGAAASLRRQLERYGDAVRDDEDDRADEEGA
jgi:hypothetical protein